MMIHQILKSKKRKNFNKLKLTLHQFFMYQAFFHVSFNITVFYCKEAFTLTYQDVNIVRQIIFIDIIFIKPSIIQSYATINLDRKYKFHKKINLNKSKIVLKIFKSNPKFNHQNIFYSKVLRNKKRGILFFINSNMIFLLLRKFRSRNFHFLLI